MTLPDMTIIRRAGMMLDDPRAWAWTVQGFGMIRTYLDPNKEWRLNVWDDRLRVPQVSEIHDHPWDFESWVLCGQIANTRFHPRPNGDGGALPFQHVEIRTGEGGGPLGGVDSRYLAAEAPEVYRVGQGYRQRKTEIHITKALPGTVTINRRGPPTEAHSAHIFWPRGPWVNAEPRPATQVEVYAAVEQALHVARMDKWSAR